MRARVATAIALSVAVGLTLAVSAKGPTTKITITGDDLDAPLEIRDPATIRPFEVWAGPGTMSCVRGNCQEHTTGFIVDWPLGFVAARPAGLPQYTVSFYTASEEGVVNKAGDALRDQPTYVVLYEYDEATQQGFVYLPGKGDPAYVINAKAILRGLSARGPEGHWLHARGEWDAVATAALARRAAQ